MSKFESLKKFRLMNEESVSKNHFGGQNTWVNVYRTEDTIIYRNPGVPGSPYTISSDTVWDHLDRD